MLGRDTLPYSKKHLFPQLSTSKTESLYWYVRTPFTILTPALPEMQEPTYGNCCERLHWVNEESSQEARTNFNIAVYAQTINYSSGSHINSILRIHFRGALGVTFWDLGTVAAKNYASPWTSFLAEAHPKQSFAYIPHHRRLCSTFIRGNIVKTPLWT